jgi:hypothetical protein
LLHMPFCHLHQHFSKVVLTFSPRILYRAPFTQAITPVIVSKL